MCSAHPLQVTHGHQLCAPSVWFYSSWPSSSDCPQVYPEPSGVQERETHTDCPHSPLDLILSTQVQLGRRLKEQRGSCEIHQIWDLEGPMQMSDNEWCFRMYIAFNLCHLSCSTPGCIKSIYITVTRVPLKDNQSIQWPRYDSVPCYAAGNIEAHWAKPRTNNNQHHASTVSSTRLHSLAIWTQNEADI